MFQQPGNEWHNWCKKKMCKISTSFITIRSHVKRSFFSALLWSIKYLYEQFLSVNEQLISLVLFLCTNIFNSDWILVFVKPLYQARMYRFYQFLYKNPSPVVELRFCSKINFYFYSYDLANHIEINTRPGLLIEIQNGIKYLI